MGMAEITKRSEAAGLTEKGSAAAIVEALKKYGLPYQIPVIDKKELIGAMRLDKKFNGDIISLVLLDKLGAAFTRKIMGEELESFI